MLIEGESVESSWEGRRAQGLEQGVAIQELLSVLVAIRLGQVPSVLLSTQVGVECLGEPVRSRIASLLMWQERLEEHRSKKMLVPWISAVTQCFRASPGQEERAGHPFLHCGLLRA